MYLTDVQEETKTKFDITMFMDMEHITNLMKLFVEVTTSALMIYLEKCQEGSFTILTNHTNNI